MAANDVAFYKSFLKILMKKGFRSFRKTDALDGSNPNLKNGYKDSNAATQPIIYKTPYSIIT